MPCLQGDSHQLPCPVCDATATTKVIQIHGVPVFCNMLWESREKARHADRGNIDLVFCHTCGHLYNAAFDPDRMQYSPQYDNALDYSPTFQKYIRTLALRLVDTYQLYEKDVIEIGCGQGEFLRLLAEIGQNRCLGFDPSYDPQKIETDNQADLFSVIRDYYSEQYANHQADFFACRQVLEHIMAPADFMKMV
jgi:2-polyprenyl-3-methyl-5-hydroxy-6-metoxy-1,4-benzoquinol methylase